MPSPVAVGAVPQSGPDVPVADFRFGGVRGRVQLLRGSVGRVVRDGDGGEPEPDGVRDFLECASLSMRYFQLARSLGDLEDRLLKLAATAGVGGVLEANLAEIVDEGERLIGSEFRSWKLVQEAVPTDWRRVQRWRMKWK